PDPMEPNDDVAQVRSGRLFEVGQAPLTTPAAPSARISASIDSEEDPRDVYRIWVPAHRTVRVTVASEGRAAVRIWGPLTVSVNEGVKARRRDLRGPRGRGPAQTAPVLGVRRGAPDRPQPRRDLHARRHGNDTLTPAVPSRPPGFTAGFWTRTRTRSARNRACRSTATACASASSRSYERASETACTASATWR